MCCLRISCYDYLLPMEAGVKVMQLLAGAVAVNHGFDRDAGDVYEVAGELPRMQIEPVTQRQGKWPAETIVPAPPKRQRRLALGAPD